MLWLEWRGVGASSTSTWSLHSAPCKIGLAQTCSTGGRPHAKRTCLAKLQIASWSFWSIGGGPPKACLHGPKWPRAWMMGKPRCSWEFLEDGGEKKIPSPCVWGHCGQWRVSSFAGRRSHLVWRWKECLPFIGLWRLPKAWQVGFAGSSPKPTSCAEEGLEEQSCYLQEACTEAGDQHKGQARALHKGQARAKQKDQSGGSQKGQSSGALQKGQSGAIQILLMLRFTRNLWSLVGVSKRLTSSIDQTLVRVWGWWWQCLKSRLHTPRKATKNW